MKYFRNPSSAGKASQKVQAESRMAGPAPEYPPILDPDSLFKRIMVESFWPNGDSLKTVIDLFPVNRGRRDQFKANLDGKLWRERVCLTQVFEWLRKRR
jgi:hypothetical protein